ncbi:MAG: hypothetical protein IIC61_06160 [Proteobacteria bacterium]|nr:hypothetical protein [Pseudomonadota bacterium]
MPVGGGGSIRGKGRRRRRPRADAQDPHQSRQRLPDRAEVGARCHVGPAKRLDICRWRWARLIGGAVLYAPSDLKIGSGGVIRPVSLVRLDEPIAGRRIVRRETAVAIRHMMEVVVRPGGTGNNASITGYRVAGKTGTAWKFAVGGYSEDKYFSIFAGFVPASDPRLVAVVVIDEPSGDLYYGSDVAAPVFADVMSGSLRLLAIPPDALPVNGVAGRIQAMSQ